MTNPLVSIITPCYNGEQFINDYFDCILKQTYRPLELIFVNDGSIDQTKKIALDYKPKLEKAGIIVKLIDQMNSGQAAAINNALKYVTGKYLIWPDSDDLLAPDSIDTRVRFLEQHSQYSLVRSNGRYFDFVTKEDLGRVSESDNRFHEDIFMDLIMEKTYCDNICYMIKTEALRSFYPNLSIYVSPAGQNWQLLIPLAGNSLCGYIDEDLCYIAVRADSHSRQKRSLKEDLERSAQLKEILLKSIEISGRDDKDYKAIVDEKYEYLFFKIHINHKDVVQAESYYKKLKKTLTQEDKLFFYLNIHPAKYRMYWLFIRAKGRIKRILCI